MSNIIIALCLSTLAHGAHAHGYVSISRNIKCQQGINADCGDIIYEPWSLEGPEGFPSGGPPDGRIASADGTRPSQTQGLFLQLDVQTEARWSKTSVGAGPMNFDWTFTANHVTRDWKYYLTNPGWNSNAPLARSSFDLNPFCTVSGNQAQPPFSVTHACSLPSRAAGEYHVILAVWDIGDTVNAFYNCLDVQFSGAAVAPVVPAPAPSTPAPPPTPAPPTEVIDPAPVPAPVLPVPEPPTPAPPVPAPAPAPGKGNGGGGGPHHGAKDSRSGDQPRLRGGVAAA